MKHLKPAVILLLLGVLIAPASHAQEKRKTEEIPPEIFYRNALIDPFNKASLQSVLDWQKEDSVVLIDLRSNREFKQSHIRGAINIPTTELTQQTLKKHIPTTNSRVVIYCANNIKMTRMVPLTTLGYPTLKQQGYQNVYVLENLTKKDWVYLEPNPDQSSQNSP